MVGGKQPQQKKNVRGKPGSPREFFSREVQVVGSTMTPVPKFRQCLGGLEYQEARPSEELARRSVERVGESGRVDPNLLCVEIRERGVAGLLGDDLGVG